MKKRTIKIVAVLALVLLISACGSVAEKTDLAELAVAEKTDLAEPAVTEKTEIAELAVKEELPEATKQVTEPEPETKLKPEAVVEPETLGNPRSSYGLGSAPYLKGDNLLVSMFVTTPESGWNEEEKQVMLEKVGVAAEYIETAAAEYGIELQLIYNYEEHPSLYVEATTDFCVNEETNFPDRLDEEIALWFETCIDYEALLATYDAEGIATMVMVNNPGISYAIVYDGTDNVKESLVLFTGDYYHGGEPEKPITYAHEILHLFGAHDLYEEAEFTSEVTAYVEQTYPREIMLTVTGGGNTQTEIEADLSQITAYHLGWVNEAEEIKLFPQLNRE